MSTGCAITTRATSGSRSTRSAAERPGGIVLDPHDFYILASREAVVVPPDHAAEMLPYDTFVGEFRVHFAGFFDPGFGTAETGGAGSRAVLEVRSHEVPFLIEHGQIVGRLVYERLIARPDKLYGARHRLVLPAPGTGAVEAFQEFVKVKPTGGAALSRWRMQPIEADEGVAALDRTGIEQGLDLGHGLDHDADVLVLVGKPVTVSVGAWVQRDDRHVDPLGLTFSAAC